MGKRCNRDYEISRRKSLNRKATSHRRSKREYYEFCYDFNLKLDMKNDPSYYGYIIEEDNSND